MLIQVNGKPKEVASGTTIEALLQQLQLNVHQVVVERNTMIVNKQCYADDLLVEGDILEIVHFVGGG